MSLLLLFRYPTGAVVDATVEPVGVEAVASIGSLDGVTGTSIHVASGVESTAAVGSSTITGTSSIAAVGVESASAIGTPAVTATAIGVPPGVDAAASIGTPTETATAIHAATGVGSVASVGAPTENGTAIVDPSGVGATASVGVPSETATSVVATSGVGAAGSVGSTAQTGTSAVSPAGVAATADVGSIVADGSASVALGGVQAEASVGSVQVQTSGSQTVSPQGVQATCSVGDPTVLVSSGVDFGPEPPMGSGMWTHPRRDRKAEEELEQSVDVVIGVAAPAALEISVGQCLVVVHGDAKLSPVLGLLESAVDLGGVFVTTDAPISLLSLKRVSAIVFPLSETVVASVGSPIVVSESLPDADGDDEEMVEVLVAMMRAVVI